MVNFLIQNEMKNFEFKEILTEDPIWNQFVMFVPFLKLKLVKEIQSNPLLHRIGSDWKNMQSETTTTAAIIPTF